MVKNPLDVIQGGFSYWIFGFAYSFGQGDRSSFSSVVDYFFTVANEGEMGAVFTKYFFQLSFATTATTMVSGENVKSNRNNWKTTSLPTIKVPLGIFSLSVTYEYFF